MSYALAQFVEEGVLSESWDAVDVAGSAGLSDGVANLGGASFNGVSHADCHINAPVLSVATDDVFTGWKRVALSGFPSTFHGWQCKRPGVWRIVSSVFTKLVPEGANQLTVAEFTLYVSRYRSGTPVHRVRRWNYTLPPQASYDGNVNRSVSFVDYVEFQFDDILALRTGSYSSRVTAITTSTINAQTSVGMWGNLSVEKVTPHWSEDDRTAAYVPGGGEEG